MTTVINLHGDDAWATYERERVRLVAHAGLDAFLEEAERAQLRAGDGNESKFTIIVSRSYTGGLIVNACSSIEKVL